MPPNRSGLAMTSAELYICRINAVIDFIETHLDEKLSLEELSRVAHFSKYHFHRIFGAFMGESLYAFITRLRVERAAALLPHSPARITDIAFDLGFEDSATFARAFKKHFGVPASRWKADKNRKIHQASHALPGYYKLKLNTGNDDAESCAIEDLQLPSTELFYVRYQGPYAQDYRLFARMHHELLEALQRLAVEWNEKSGFYAIYHDPLGITADQQLRISYGVEASGTEAARPKAVDGLSRLTIAAGRYLFCRFVLANHEYGRAWTAVYRDILPQRGLQPVDGYCFEHYFADCYDPTTESTTVSIAVPVKEL
ncbi:MAG: AraC family transcriptional regulator [Spirochaetota bacterium]